MPRNMQIRPWRAGWATVNTANRDLTRLIKLVRRHSRIRDMGDWRFYCADLRSLGERLIRLADELEELNS